MHMGIRVVNKAAENKCVFTTGLKNNKGDEAFCQSCCLETVLQMRAWPKASSILKDVEWFEL